MKKLTLTALTLTGIMLLNSCEENFDMIADYEDVTIIYGLLNRDSATYIKINKAFLGEESALVMAKVPDSSQYQNLEVYLDELNINGADTNIQNSITLDAINIDNKDSGLFYYPTQMLYHTEEQLNDEHTYKLRVKVNAQKEVTSFTNLIPDFSFLIPRPYGEEINFLESSPFSTKIKWTTPENGKLYDVKIRFSYKEKSIGHDTIIRSFDWYLGSLQSKDANGGDNIQVLYDAANFYVMCEQLIPYKGDQAYKEADVQIRIPLLVDILIDVANEEFNTFMEVNNATGSVVESLVEYTNINNGLGLFASRYNKKLTKLLGLESYQVLKSSKYEYLKF